MQGNYWESQWLFSVPIIQYSQACPQRGRGRGSSTAIQYAGSTAIAQHPPMDTDEDLNGGEGRQGGLWY